MAVSLLQFFFVCASLVLLMAFGLSLFVPNLSPSVWCLEKALSLQKNAYSSILRILSPKMKTFR